MSGSDLADFPRPSVAVDVSLLTVVEGEVRMVLLRRSGRTSHGEWALPGSFLREGERLDEAVGRTLWEKCGMRGFAPTQLKVMDDPNRDDRGWVLSVAHLAVVNPSVLLGLSDSGDVRPVALRPSVQSGRRGSVLRLPDGQRRLPFDHEDIARLAIDELRSRHDERPDPFGLLPAKFTILQLRQLHEAVAGGALQKDTFRRAMLPYLEQLDETEEGVMGRPARLFRKG